MQEVTAQMCCRHPNVMPLLEYRIVDMNDQLYLGMVIPLATITLHSLFASTSVRLDAHSLMQQLLEALAHCHHNQVIHNDLKPDNLMITLRDDQPPLLQIADFGRARIMMHPNTQLRATNVDGSTDSYRAPEIKLGYEHFDQAVDVWAAGCIFYQMHQPQSQRLFAKAPRPDILTMFTQLVRLFGIAAVEEMLPLATPSLVQQFRLELPTLRPLSNSDWAQTTAVFSTDACSVFSNACRANPASRYSCRQLLALPYFSLNTS